jgi:hypothetical protein
MRKAVPVGLVLIATFIAANLPVFAGDQMVDIESALKAKYAPSTLTRDRFNLVEVGSPVALRVNNLFASNHFAFTPGNTYKDGKIHSSKLHLEPDVKQHPEYRSRTFVSGEHLWVTKLEVTSHEVVFDVCSDDLYGVRYRAKVKFLLGDIEKLTTAQVMEKIAEVFETASAK